MKNNINDFLYLDSDILFFNSVDKCFNNQAHFEFTVCNKIGPQYAYFTGVDKIQKFCVFLNNLYTDARYSDRLEAKHKYHIDNQLPGGVCDMTAFSEYQYHQLGVVKDLSIIENDSVFDDNINVSDGFEMSKIGIKNIYIENKRAFARKKDSGKKIQFNGLHFQGPAKIYMYKFYIGGGAIRQQLEDRWFILKGKIYKALYN